MFSILSLEHKSYAELQPTLPVQYLQCIKTYDNFSIPSFFQHSVSYQDPQETNSPAYMPRILWSGRFESYIHSTVWLKVNSMPESSRPTIRVKLSETGNHITPSQLMSSLYELHNLHLGSHRNMVKLSEIGFCDMILHLLDTPHCHRAFCMLMAILSGDSIFCLSLPYRANA